MKKYCIFKNGRYEYFSEINDKKAQEFARKAGAKSLSRIWESKLYDYPIYIDIKF